MLLKLKATSKSKAKAKPKANSSEEKPDTNIEPEEPDGPGAEPEGEVEVKKKPAAKPRKGALKRPAAAMEAAAAGFGLSFAVQLLTILQPNCDARVIPNKDFSVACFPSWVLISYSQI